MDFDAVQTDAARPLTEAGVAEAHEMAQRIATTLTPMPCILSSPALRALATARAVAAAYGVADNVQVQTNIYAAAVSALLDIVREQPDDIEHLLLCGHNPGVSGLARYLTNDAPPPTLAPCSLVTLVFDVTCWRDVARATGRVEHFWRPSVAG